MKLKSEWFQRGELHTKRGYAEADANIAKGMYETNTDKWGNEIFRKMRLTDTQSKNHSVTVTNRRSRNQSASSAKQLHDTMEGQKKTLLTGRTCADPDEQHLANFLLGFDAPPRY